jgi:hypothetical protein
MTLPRRGAVDAVLAGVLALGALWPAAPRAVQALVFLGLLAALARTGWVVACALLPDVLGAARLTCATSVALGLPSLLGTALGHFALLRPSVFLVTTAVVLLLAAAVPRRAGGTAPELHPRGPEPDGLPPPWLDAIERTLLGALLLGLALVTLERTRDNRLSPAGTFGLDDPSYHLSAVAVWHRYGDLRMLKFDFGDTSTAFYPIGAELFTWALLAPFRDSDFAARWAQLPFLPGACLALWAVARALGVTRRGAAVAVALFWSVPRIVPVLALSAGNDLSACFYTLASVDALLLLGRRPSGGRAVYSGLALGLLVGTKYIGLLFCGPLAAVLAASAWAHRETWRKGRTTLLLALLAAVALLAGGYTYARNAWVTGNPAFPAQLSMAGREILPGWAAVSLSERRHLPEYEIDVWSFLTGRPDLLGPSFPLTLLPAALLAPLAAVLLPRRRALAARLETALTLALPVLLFLQFLYLMHDHRDVRYFLGGVALSATACAWLVERSGPAAAALLRAIIAAALLPQLLARTELGDSERILLAALALGVAALAGVLGQRLAPSSERPVIAWASGAALVAMAFAAPSLAASVERYQAEKLWQVPRPHMPEQSAAAALDRLVGPAGAEVAYVGWNRPYLFFGSRLQNGVHIVPTEDDLEGRFFDWRGHTRWPFSGTRYRVWRANLERLGIEYVVVLSSDQVDPERRWLRRHPDTFRRIHVDGLVEIWRVRASSFARGGKSVPDPRMRRQPYKRQERSLAMSVPAVAWM